VNEHIGVWGMLPIERSFLASRLQDDWTTEHFETFLFPHHSKRTSHLSAKAVWMPQKYEDWRSQCHRYKFLASILPRTIPEYHMPPHHRSQLLCLSNPEMAFKYHQQVKAG
jgi:hypothetical protein